MYADNRSKRREGVRWKKRFRREREAPGVKGGKAAIQVKPRAIWRRKRLRQVQPHEQGAAAGSRRLEKKRQTRTK